MWLLVTHCAGSLKAEYFPCWQDLARATEELCRGPSIVQTPRATPAGPANMVGVCFLLQMLVAESLNSSPVFFTVVPLLCPSSCPFAPPHAPELSSHTPSVFPFSPPFQNTWLGIDPGCCVLRHTIMRCCGIASGQCRVLIWMQAQSCCNQCSKDLDQ